jgi:hypothetical protein
MKQLLDHLRVIAIDSASGNATYELRYLNNTRGTEAGDAEEDFE